MSTIAVAVSGGVDSLGALLRLKQAGHNVLALHGLFLHGGVVPPKLARICQEIGAEFIVVDLREQFQTAVIDYFKNEYANGRTPNPCAICNRAIKFGFLLDYALRAGADKFATGHYATIEIGPCQTPVLGRAADPDKDQAYFLSLIEPGSLNHVMFPLATQTKAQTRQQVSQRGYIPPLGSESQDICFISSDDPKKAGRFPATPGPILLRGEKDIDTPLEKLPEIGKHNGLGNYTIGQRKGLRTSWTEPLYAREFDPETNTLIVSPRRLLAIHGVILGSTNYFLKPEYWPDRLFVRLRYRQPLAEANIDFSGMEVKIQLKQPCFTSAPGQIAAIYDQAGHILAGGIIETVLRSTGAS